MKRTGGNDGNHAVGVRKLHLNAHRVRMKRVGSVDVGEERLERLLAVGIGWTERRADVLVAGDGDGAAAGRSGRRGDAAVMLHRLRQAAHAVLGAKEDRVEHAVLDAAVRRRLAQPLVYAIYPIAFNR